MKHIRFEPTLKLLFIIGFLFINYSCQRKDNALKTSDKTDTVQEKVNGSYLESVYYRFPTPNEIFGFINNEKLKYDPKLLNPLTNVEKYIDSKSQTLGLGIYVSDLVYVTFFEAYSKSTEYYKVIHQLSEKVRIVSAYDLEVTQRIEKNLLNIDSLKNISVDSYASMVEYLVLNNRERTLALIATGAYIECFYISFNLAGKYSTDNPMIVRIVDLKYAFDNLNSYLQIFSDDPNVKEVASDIAKLTSLFNQMEEKNLGKTKMKQNDDGSFSLDGGVKLSVSKELFTELKNEIFRLRNKFVNAE